MIRKLKSFRKRLEAQSNHIHTWLTEERKYLPTPIQGPVLFCMSHRMAAYLLVVFVGLSSLFGFLFNVLFPMTAAMHAPSMLGMVETKIMHIFVDLFGFYFVPRGFYGVMEHQLSGLRVFFYYALARICIFVPICSVQLILGNICDAKLHGHTWVSPHEQAHPMRCSIMEMVELVYVGITFLVYAVLLQAYFQFWEQAEIELSQKKPNATVGENTSLMPPPAPGSQYPITYSIHPGDGSHGERGAQWQQDRRHHQPPPSYGHGPGPGHSQLAHHNGYNNNHDNNQGPTFASNYAPVPINGPQQAQPPLSFNAEYTNSYQEYPAYPGYSSVEPYSYTDDLNPDTTMIQKSNIVQHQQFHPAPAVPGISQGPSPRGRSPPMGARTRGEEGNESQPLPAGLPLSGDRLGYRPGRPHSQGSQSSRGESYTSLSKEDKEYLQQRKISLGLGTPEPSPAMPKKASTMEEHEANTHENAQFLAARRTPRQDDLPVIHQSLQDDQPGLDQSQQEDLGTSFGSSPSSKLRMGSGTTFVTTELMTEGATNDGGSLSLTSQTTLERKAALVLPNPSPWSVDE